MNDPKCGDIIACTDGDIGVVLDFWDDTHATLVRIAWNSGQTLTDTWNAEDFDTGGDMFSILSRA
tara:strand:- start:2289 stop:2483 length:195 start_codon:yes stop_codon:yes gene_type:complete